MKKKKDKKKQLNIRLEPTIAEKLKILAMVHHTSKTAIIRKMINHYYKKTISRTE